MLGEQQEHVVIGQQADAWAFAVPLVHQLLAACGLQGSCALAQEQADFVSGARAGIFLQAGDEPFGFRQRGGGLRLTELWEQGGLQVVVGVCALDGHATVLFQFLDFAVLEDAAVDVKPGDVSGKGLESLAQQDGAVAHVHCQIVDFAQGDDFIIDRDAEAVAVDAVGLVQMALDIDDQEIPASVLGRGQAV